MFQQTIHAPAINKVEDHQEGKSATFVIEPLMSGYGQTLANSLRRVLLSSISGAAVIAFRIKGLSHEFTTIPGAKEDALEIRLNVMGLRFRWLGEDQADPVIVKLTKQGSGPVTGADIEGGGLVEVVNLDHLVATLDGPSDKLELELRIGHGRGYLTLDDSNEIQLDKAADFIVVDAHFCPVRRVRYKIDNTRVGQMTNLDTVSLTVETDGTIGPREAFEEAAAILQEHYAALAGATTVAVDSFSDLLGGDPDQPDPSQLDPRLMMRIDDLEMSTRTINAFIRAGLHQIKDVINYSDAELQQIPSLGVKGVAEFKDQLKELGF